MPVVEGGHKATLTVPGLYEALRLRERQHHDRHDGFVAATGLAYKYNRDLLDALEAGQPATVQGRNLKGWGVPKVGLRRDQAFDRFTVHPDDTVVPHRDSHARNLGKGDR